jgi:hypothetical protein
MGYVARVVMVCSSYRNRINEWTQHAEYQDIFWRVFLHEMLLGSRQVSFNRFETFDRAISYERAIISFHYL